MVLCVFDLAEGGFVLIFGLAWGVFENKWLSHPMDWGVGSREGPGQCWGRGSFGLETWKMPGQWWVGERVIMEGRR